jgi:hypothetical protein
MIDVDRKIGPLRLRAWGLVVNFFANAAALVGLAQVMGGGNGWPLLIGGAAVTALCLGVCAIPARGE